MTLPVRCALVLASLAAALVGPAQAQQAFRIEVHPITTVDLTGAQVLAGKLEGPARVIAGELRLPFTDQVRVPAVVFLHGDAGAVSSQPIWIDQLNAAGIAVFTVDSFSARGAVGRGPSIFIDNVGPIGSLGRVADAQRALALLAGHPRIDPGRIVLMGVSSGARTTLNAAIRRFGEPYAGAGAAFAGYVALYPGCNVKLEGETDLLPGPVQIHHGAADTITRPAFCRAYVERLRAAGRDAQFFEYADALHGFDSAPRMPMQHLAQAPNASACELEERGTGGLVNVQTGEPLKPTDTCVTQGIGGGPNTAAAAALRARVLSFLRQRFKLPD